MFFERTIHQSLQKHLTKKQITVITGIRRSGKTTLVQHLLTEVRSANQLYLDLQRVDNRELFLEKNYDNIVRSLAGRGLDFSRKVYLALDEMQLVPETVSVLKYLYDHYDCKFLVTGSSSFYLKNLFTESLSGRKKIFELYPLDFGEFLTFKGVRASAAAVFLKTHFQSDEYEQLKSYYEEYIRFGGFPEVVLSDDPDHKKDLLVDIMSSYINIDIRTLADVRNDRDVYRLAKLLAGRVGSRLDYMKLSRLSGISRPTVHNYVDLFEKSYLIHRVSVLAKRADREIVKAQKLYFCDTGLANVLATLDGGTQFENTVFNQLRQQGTVRYYALKTGREIDFILDDAYALEVKESPMETDLRVVEGMAQLAGLSNARLIGRYAVPKFTDYIWGGQIR